MDNRVARIVATCTLAAIVLAESAEAGPREATASIDSAVVLELFTSQGCSSCPAAERILNLLGRDESIKERLIPLAFHVDYWNDLGWFDPFSARGWTERQSAYGNAFGLDSNYTPQLVINGRAQLNGANAAALVTELNTELARQPPATLGLIARRNGKAVDVDVSAQLKEELAARKLEVMVA